MREKNPHRRPPLAACLIAAVLAGCTPESGSVSPQAKDAVAEHSAAAKAEQAEKDADARVAAVQFDAKLDSAIAAAHGRSGKAIRALLDLDALRGSEDPDKDIPAALAALQKDSGYMFDTEETPPPYAAGTGRTAMTTDNSDSALRKAMGLPME